jgi:putative flippase GtrA
MKRLSQWLRYGMVSAIATGTSLTVLGALVATRSVSAGWANVIATTVGMVPSFELNRRWVWRKHGNRSVASEVVPFGALSVCGLMLSTLAVRGAASWADGAHLSAGTRTIAVEGANLAAFGSLWVIQFLVLDRLLFGTRVPASEPV